MILRRTNPIARIALYLPLWFMHIEHVRVGRNTTDYIVINMRMTKA